MDFAIRRYGGAMAATISIAICGSNVVEKSARGWNGARFKIRRR
jgi:hypothetical protein